MRFPSTTLVVLLCLAFASTPVAASTVRFLTDAELIARSDRVVHGRVIGQRPARAGPDGAIYTVTTITVFEDLTGVAGDTVEVWELGGTDGSESMAVSGAVEFGLGEEVVVCLRRGRAGLHTVGMGLSKFELQRDPAGARQMVRRLGDTLVLGGTAAPAGRTFDGFRRLARQVTGRTPRAGLRADAVDAPSPAEPYQYRGARWLQADSGVPIDYYVNSSAVSPLGPASPTAAVLAALATWSNPANASVMLQYVGTTSQATPNGPWTGIPSRSVVISFEDPADEIDDPVLAITISFTVTGSGGTVHGARFDGYARAAIKFQNAADLPLSYRQLLNFTRVLTHEVGHSIGLGHTQDDGTVANPTANIMYPSCCYAATPTPPALGPDDLEGLSFLYPTAAPCTFTVTPLSASYPASGGSGSVTITTSPDCAWTAANQSTFLTVSPGGGSGAAEIYYNVAANGGAERAGTFTVGGQTITIGQSPTVQTGTSRPFGIIDTPLDQISGVTGAVPFTGWALDDVEVAGVSVCRSAVAGERAVADPRCAGAALIYVADGIFVDGARPDVQAKYPSYPRSGRAGWGALVLTNMLPYQGNGTYVFWMYAADREGQMTLLGTRTMTCDNAHATLPFGTIDTPAPGETVSGRAYLNFGWALTQNPKAIPTDGSTLAVYVDGVAVGRPSYGHYRIDIAGAFPGLANSDGAVGFWVLDTTTLTNGLHTISWTASDTAGATAGIGSRYFTVLNGSAATAGVAQPIERAAAAGAAAGSGSDPRIGPAAIDAAAVEPATIAGRRGWGPDAPWRAYASGDGGRIIVRGEELDRIELELGEAGTGAVTGYLRVGRTLAPLPVGSGLDPATGVFTWSPGVGFVGAYDLVFVRRAGGRSVSRQEVRIVLRPKVSGQIRP